MDYGVLKSIHHGEGDHGKAIVLVLPHFLKPFTTIMNASELGISIFLLQEYHPVAFYSRKFSHAEHTYSTTFKEMLAIVHALQTLRCYLEGVCIVVIMYLIHIS